METVAACRSSFSCLSPYPVARSGPGRIRVASKSTLSNSWVQQKPSISRMKLSTTKMGFMSKKQTAIRASILPSDSGISSAPIAPLQLESPIGQLLSQILVSHPHLVPAAVEQQLEQLQTDRDAENEKDEPSASGTELVLYRRIAKVKANERREAVEEILYALVVQKFMDANVTLVPTLTPSPPNKSGVVDTSPSQEEKLESLHSPEAYEMIQSHLSLILGKRLDDSTSVAQISKLRVGQVYAASVMYGYFLKRVDQRFKLEKSMKILPQGCDMEDSATEQVIEEDKGTSGEKSNEPVMNTVPHPEVTSWPGGTGSGNFGGAKLRNYVMSFDGESLQRYATIRSREAINIIEKHTEALFGRPEIVITPDGAIDSSKDESIKISFSGLRRLVLEAVTFGSFLWDVESYVDSSFSFSSASVVRILPGIYFSEKSRKLRNSNDVTTSGGPNHQLNNYLSQFNFT